MFKYQTLAAEHVETLKINAPRFYSRFGIPEGDVICHPSVMVQDLEPKNPEDFVILDCGHVAGPMVAMQATVSCALAAAEIGEDVEFDIVFDVSYKAAVKKLIEDNAALEAEGKLPVGFAEKMAEALADKLNGDYDPKSVEGTKYGVAVFFRTADFGEIPKAAEANLEAE